MSHISENNNILKVTLQASYRMSTLLSYIAIGSDGSVTTGEDRNIYQFGSNLRILWKNSLFEFRSKNEHYFSRFMGVFVSVDGSLVTVLFSDGRVCLFSKGGDLLWSSPDKKIHRFYFPTKEDISSEIDIFENNVLLKLHDESQIRSIPSEDEIMQKIFIRNKDMNDFTLTGDLIMASKNQDTIHLSVRDKLGLDKETEDIDLRKIKDFCKIECFSLSPDGLLIGIVSHCYTAPWSHHFDAFVGPTNSQIDIFYIDTSALLKKEIAGMIEAVLTED